MKVRPHPFVVFRISFSIMQSFRGPRTISHFIHSGRFLAALAIVFLVSPSVFASKFNPEQELQQHYDAARTYQISGDNQHASTEYETFLSLALQQCAKIRAVSGDPQEAAVLFDQALRLTPNDNRLLMSYAYLRLQQH